MRVLVCPSRSATTFESTPRCLSQLAYVRRRSLGVTFGIPSALHAAERSRRTLCQVATTAPCFRDRQQRRLERLGDRHPALRLLGLGAGEEDPLLEEIDVVFPREPLDLREPASGVHGDEHPQLALRAERVEQRGELLGHQVAPTRHVLRGEGGHDRCRVVDELSTLVGELEGLPERHELLCGDIADDRLEPELRSDVPTEVARGRK